MVCPQVFGSGLVPQPALAEPENWTVKPGDESVLSHTALPGWLKVGFNCDKGNTGRLLLKEPITIPADTSGMNFLCTNNGPLASLRIKVMIKDVKGREYLYHTGALDTYKHGLFIPEQDKMRSTELMFGVPGLARPKLVGNAGATITAIGKHRAKPEAPLQLLGLYFEGEHQLAQQKQTPQFFFRNFVFTNLTPTTTKLYYQFGQEYYGEVAPVPYITPRPLGKWFGKRFDITWQVFKDYDGQPVLAGRKNIEIEYGNDEKPLAVQLAEHIDIPVIAPGTWWVRAKLRWWGHKSGVAPEHISEKEYRLYVHKSHDKTVFSPLSAEEDIPGSYIRMAPQRRSLIFDANEPFRLPIRFEKPKDELANLNCRIEIRRGQGGAVVKELTFSPSWQDELFEAVCDLSDLPAGAYELQAALLSGKSVFDKTTRMIGRKDSVQDRESMGKAVLRSVPSWQQLLKREAPLFHLTPVLPDDGVKIRQQEAWEKHQKPFLDHAAEISRDIEFMVPWKVVEPLQGVYDWSTVDRFLDYAKTKGLQVILYPEYRSQNVPEWIPSVFEENPEGKLFGHGKYTFHGARPNMFHSSAFRKPLMAFIAAMVERYRNHPALQGYYTCLEHPGDASYKGWYEGYSSESRKAWIAYAKENWKFLKLVNQRWQTSFKNWDEVDHPDRHTASKRFKLDWLLFRTHSFEAFLKEIVTTIRERDQHRLIVVYGDGVNDLSWFRERGCISANGGSQDVIQWGTYAQHGLQNYPMRTEDISPGNWSASFPTQMDASIFAMMAGGGVNATARAFIRTNMPWSEYTDTDTGRGRFKRFLPIWEELRRATAQPIETFVYNSIESYLAYAKTTFQGAYNDPWQVINLHAAQVAFSYGPPVLWGKGKLLILTNDRSALEQNEIDRIIRYVKNGGTVFMQADYGRSNIDSPNEEWSLLTRFGFAPPQKTVNKGRQINAIPVSGGLFLNNATPFRVRDIWKVSKQDGVNEEAYFDAGKTIPALSWKSFGKGKVAVLWAQTIIPPMVARGSYPFLRDVAKWAGVELYSKASTDLFWTNFLIGKDGKTFYGLVHVGSRQGRPKSTVSGNVQWLKLPQGNYEVTELISGEKLGTLPAEELKTRGLEVTLNPKEVSIFKMRIKQ
jgi:hypothetical protein